jgi:hypothetical protein
VVSDVLERQHTFWNAHFRSVWEYVCIVGLAYHLLFLPLRIGSIMYPTSSSTLSRWWIYLIFDVLADLVFAGDILLRYHRFGVFDASSGQFVVEPLSIARRYLRSPELVYDVLAVVPLDVLVLYGGAWSSDDALMGRGYQSTSRPLFLLNRLFRLVGRISLLKLAI